MKGKECFVPFICHVYKTVNRFTKKKKWLVTMWHNICLLNLSIESSYHCSESKRLLKTLIGFCLLLLVCYVFVSARSYVASYYWETTEGSHEQLSGRPIATHSNRISEEGQGQNRKNRDHRDGHQAHEVSAAGAWHTFRTLQVRRCQ